MSKTVTISKAEYERLHRIAKKYEKVREALSHDLFYEPTSQNITEIMRDFRATKKYSTKFLKSLERGLKESDYFQKS